jgi:hypothetical protein
MYRRADADGLHRADDLPCSLTLSAIVRLVDAPQCMGARVLRIALACGCGLKNTFRKEDRYSTVRIDYQDGLRYPLLQRDANAPARLNQILSPRN